MKIAKSFGALNGTLRRARRRSVVPSSMTLSTSSGERGIVAMWIVSSCEFFVSGKCRSKVEIGMIDDVVGLPAEARRALLLERPDDLDALAVDREGLPDRVLALPERLHDVLPEDGDVRRVQDVRLRDVPAVLDRPVVADRVVLVARRRSSASSPRCRCPSRPTAATCSARGTRRGSTGRAPGAPARPRA